MGMQFAANPLLQFVWEIFFSYMWYNGSLVAETEYLMVMCCRSVSTGIILVQYNSPKTHDVGYYVDQMA